jgi:hypothetical protein
MPYNICFLPILLYLQAASFAAVDKTIENRFIRNRFKRGMTKRSQTAAVYERFPSTVFLRTRYALGASTGQTPAQAPQSMQVSGSIAYLPSSLTLMAPTGHSPSQVPQPMQVSLSIVYAITQNLRFLDLIHHTIRERIFQQEIVIFLQKATA